MKKLIILLAIATVLMSCNDPKDPPPDWIVKAKIEQAKADSIAKLEMKPIN